MPQRFAGTIKSSRPIVDAMVAAVALPPTKTLLAMMTESTSIRQSHLSPAATAPHTRVKARWTAMIVAMATKITGHGLRHGRSHANAGVEERHATGGSPPGGGQQAGKDGHGESIRHSTTARPVERVTLSPSIPTKLCSTPTKAAEHTEMATGRATRTTKESCPRSRCPSSMLLSMPSSPSPSPARKLALLPFQRLSPSREAK